MRTGAARRARWRLGGSGRFLWEVERPRPGCGNSSTSWPRAEATGPDRRPPPAPSSTPPCGARWLTAWAPEAHPGAGPAVSGRGHPGGRRQVAARTPSSRPSGSGWKPWRRRRRARGCPGRQPLPVSGGRQRHGGLAGGRARLVSSPRQRHDEFSHRPWPGSTGPWRKRSGATVRWAAEEQAPGLPPALTRA